MAAHILTGLIEYKHGWVTATQLRHALSYARMGDCMEWEDWHALNRAVDVHQFRALAIALLPVYERRWFELGWPATAEDWIMARCAQSARTQEVEG